MKITFRFPIQIQTNLKLSKQKPVNRVYCTYAYKNLITLVISVVSNITNKNLYIYLAIF